jgi:succinate dehydrogenase/fumarate reductase flavoprotein subunit
LLLFVALGGRFVNAKGEQFIAEYDPELRDRASLSRISAASAMEVRAGRGPIYLDMTHFAPDDVRKMRAVLPIPTRILERVGVLVAEMYLRSHLLREESRERCLREDYPYTDNINWLKWTMLKQENGKMRLWTEDIPVERYKAKPNPCGITLFSDLCDTRRADSAGASNTGRTADKN